MRGGKGPGADPGIKKKRGGGGCSISFGRASGAENLQTPWLVLKNRKFAKNREGPKSATENNHALVIVHELWVYFGHFTYKLL